MLCLWIVTIITLMISSFTNDIVIWNGYYLKYNQYYVLFYSALAFSLYIFLILYIDICKSIYCRKSYNFYDFVICRCLMRELERHFVFRWPSGASMGKRFIAKNLKECMTWSLPLIRICVHVLLFTRCLSEKTIWNVEDIIHIIFNLNKLIVYL